MPQPDHQPTALVIAAEPGLIGEYLLTRSWRVVHAVSGADAIALAQRHAPEMVIMDLDLENLDPYEMAVDLESMPATAGADLVVIASAAEDDEAIRPRCRGRILRPVTEEALAAVLDPYLRRLASPERPDGAEETAAAPHRGAGGPRRRPPGAH